LLKVPLNSNQSINQSILGQLYEHCSLVCPAVLLYENLNLYLMSKYSDDDDDGGGGGGSRKIFMMCWN